MALVQRTPPTDLALVRSALHKRKLGLKCPFFLDPKPSEEAAAFPPKLSRSRGRTHLAMSEADAEEPDADEAQAEEIVDEPSQVSITQ